MADPWENAVEWLPAAQAGSTEALGQVLEACRAYLLLIAQQELEPEFQAKGGASDLVQQTFLEAHRDFAQFHGTTHEALLAWMRRLLLTNLANFRRDYRRHKRKVTREVALPGGDSSFQGTGGLPGDTPTPSVATMRNEQNEALERALQRLPEDYRLVVQLRYREERSFEEIATLMQRSQNAVRKLWARAIERLQQEL
ncbi:MAG TPA: sigma-70 family RNA polymerase sigma factor [Gemmataceae bacterium]|jgi:RNA polymerase sigma-70 factor (ECF subfamily)|nr:sigma-70 family RNA polymerase sigma factor [Gemmataceae bacterium]